MESLISQPLIKWGIAGAFILGAVLLGTMAITQIKQWSFIGSGTTATNTISVSGKGEIFICSAYYR
jgi:hypothetical protein